MRKKEHISWLGKMPTHRARSLKSTPVASPVAIADDAVTPLPPEPRRLLSLLTSAERKTYPMCRGLLDYFPDVFAEASRLSYLGNEKHNPGQPLHHARDKSTDHVDCIMRHLAERGGFETIVIDGVEHRVRHSIALVWRAAAYAQEELEAAYGLSTPRGASDAPK